MRNTKTYLAVALFTVGTGAFASPAFAGPTTEQAAAESDLPAATPPTADARGQGVILPGSQSGSPAVSSNGLAQGRIAGGEQAQDAP